MLAPAQLPHGARGEWMRPVDRERYDRSHDDLRMSPEKRVKIAAEFLRAAHHADHVYEERIEEGLEEYRRIIVGEEEGRH